MVAVHISYVEAFGNIGQFFSFLSLIMSLLLFFSLFNSSCVLHLNNNLVPDSYDLIVALS